MRILSILFAFLLVAAVPAQAQMGGSGGSGQQSGQSSPSSQQYGQQGSQQGSQQQSGSQAATGSENMISGTIISVDPNTESITITEYVTGMDRTFQAERSDLQDLKTGDKVNVTPAQDDQARAQSIEKDQSQQ